MRCALIALVLGSCLLVSCASIRPPPIGTHELASGIQADAARLNEAHSRAANAILLANVLRARDRWPTNYTVLSGIKSTPRIVVEAGATFAPLGLGNSPLPFGESTAELGQDTTSAAEYSINPLVGSEGTSVIVPLPPALFETYWDDGWPRDVLLHLFLDHLAVGVGEAGGRGARRLLGNDGDEDPCPTAPVNIRTATSCFRFAAAFIDSSANQYDVEIVEECELLGSGTRASLVTRENANGTWPLQRFAELHKALGDDVRLRFPDDEPANFEIRYCYGAEQILRFSSPGLPTFVAERVRSLDAIVYYLGETLRQGNGSAARIQDRVGSGCRELNGEESLVPMFRVYAGHGEDSRAALVSRFRSDRSYAAYAEHAGAHYYAAPQEFYAGPSDGDRCPIERTGTVLTILNSLFLLRQSPEFLRAPESILVRP